MMIKSAAILMFLARSAEGLTDLSETEFFSSYTPQAIQSGRDDYGGTFVSSAAYSKIDNSVVLTGTSWGRFFESVEQRNDEDFDEYGRKVDHPVVRSGCFMGVAALPGESSEQANYYLDKDRDEMFWSRRQRVHTPSVNQACNNLHLFAETQRVILAGHSEERRNTTINADVTATETKHLGMLLDLDWNVDGDKSFKNIGGQELKHTVFPVALTSKSGSEKDGIFGVFMEAVPKTSAHANLFLPPHDPAMYYDYGAGFGMSIARYHLESREVTAKTKVETINQDFLKSYESNGLVYVTDIQYVADDMMIVVGSTTGHGAAYGGTPKKKATNQFDGFITKVNAVTGELYVVNTSPASMRLESSGRNKNDFINGICFDEDDSSILYVVGETEGHFPHKDFHGPRGKTSAFLTKLNVTNLDVLWTRHIGYGDTRAQAMACQVNPEGYIWVGGNVDNGALQDQDNFGGRDIWAAKFSPGGEQVYLQQLGSAEDDELALRGGLVVDEAGNAVLVGNTYGNMYREREPGEADHSDVFVLTISDFDGGFVSTLNEPLQPSGGSWVRFLLWCFIGGILGVATIYGYHFYKSHKENSATTDRFKVTQYLGRFDIDDVELRHSATGGWHCNFVGELGQGIHKGRDMTSLRSNYNYNHTEETVEFDNDDSLGASERSLLGNTRQSDSAYSDLVAAYNSSWDNQSSGSVSGGDREPLRTPKWGSEII